MDYADEPKSGRTLSPGELQELKFTRRAVVAVCAVTAFFYGMAKAPGPGLHLTLPYAAGSIIGLLFLPAVLSFVVSRKSDKWHYTFAAAFAMIFGLVLLGTLAR